MRSVSTDYSRNPQPKVIFFKYIFLSASRIANGEPADEVLLGKRPR